MTASSISHMFHNCLSVQERDGEWFPIRFSDDLLAFYDSIDEGTSIRAHSCAGITMDFFTSADEISFHYTSHAFCRPMVVFDFWEDGVFLTSIREPDQSPSGTITYCKQKKGRVRLTIHLPYCVHMSFSDFCIPDWEPIQSPNTRFLFLGDSITQGMTVLHPSQSYASQVSSFCHAACINQGVGGFVYHPDALPDIEALRTDRIFVAYGTNDYTCLKNQRLSADAFSTTVRRYMERLHRISHRIPVTVLTPLWRADCPLPREDSLFCHVESVIAKAAAQEGFSVIPGLSLVGHMDDLFADGLHPNDHGASMMASGILKSLYS